MNEEDLFYLALEKPPTERAAFLDQACGDDATLRAHIEALLKAHENPGSFLAEPAAKLEASGDSWTGEGTDAGEPVPGPRPLAEGPGCRIGPYKLLQLIGEGAWAPSSWPSSSSPCSARSP
jgi:hypothetical protein